MFARSLSTEKERFIRRNSILKVTFLSILLLGQGQLKKMINILRISEALQKNVILKHFFILVKISIMETNVYVLIIRKLTHLQNENILPNETVD